MIPKSRVLAMYVLLEHLKNPKDTLQLDLGRLNALHMVPAYHSAHVPYIIVNLTSSHIQLDVRGDRINHRTIVHVRDHSADVLSDSIP